MKEIKVESQKSDSISFEKEISNLMQEQLLFTESIYVHLPMGVEVYDAVGLLHSINDYALKMYGVENRNTVIGVVNLFNSPYVDEELKARIQRGEDIILEFEYDFDRINRNAYFSSNNKNSMIYEVKIVPVRNKKEAIIGHILLTNDVTAKKDAEFHTEESKKNLEMAMDATNMSSWVYDVYKKTFSSLYGSPVIKATSTLEELLKIMHPQDRLQLLQLFGQLEQKEIQQGQITARIYNEKEKQYRYYESRMRLSSEHFGKLLIIGTEMDVTEKVRLAKKTEELIAKRELAMQVSNIVHWDFDVRTQKFESYNDPVNDYASDKLLTIEEQMNVIHLEDRSSAYDAIQTMLSGKDLTVEFSCRIKTKHDKTWSYCNIIGVPFERDENGDIVRYTGFRQNISKQHQLDEELRERNYKMELTFKTVGMSYWDFDVESGQFRAFNDPVNDFHSEKPISPKEYLSTAHPEDVDCVREYINRILLGVNSDFNLKYRSKTKWDDEWQTLLVTGIPIERNKKGQVTRYTGIKINNTKWEKMAQELKDLKEKAELSDRLKSAFLANMSHEIRTPLNAIVGFSELMINCDDSSEKEEYMEIIQSNNELLLRLINDILDLSKIESGILERKPEKFNMSKVCSELYTMIQPKVTNPDVEFRLDESGPECLIFLDRNRLKQVWMNYLTNAVKCTQSGYIKMGYSIEGKGIRFYVEDSGVGIPVDLQDRVFGRFQKLNEFAQGTGLGLAISRAIIEGAGGKVGFISQPGKGSTFWAWVPCEIEIQEKIPSVDAQPLDQPSVLNEISKEDLKILIAEDNDSNYLLVRHILKDYNLTRALDGADAVWKARNESFDLIFMDMKMPVMGGLEATRRIREFNAKVPIIALTANAFDSDKGSAIEAGCNAFLAKPLSKKQLLEIFSTKW
ncbi:PAS domain-containing hybrid sensor histidine kinase/response regulator [Bacteroides nordii]|uniref:PAS domain-containing hybrid sensor histidine kinase/response regulator n=1 Tax=Bacteroides nordii TaxID=291645 RepID=UPI00203F5EE7|nr:response regulator [Bacteroides nordii]GFZ41778.1 hybrid sensor histidine kinase/response regulator [Bacteroides nordii]